MHAALCCDPLLSAAYTNEPYNNGYTVALPWRCADTWTFCCICLLLQLRAGATLRFPRALPINRDDPDAFKLQVHRLSLKTLW